jgi:hypothetical protein
VRVQKRADRQPRLFALDPAEALEQRDRLISGEWVLHHAGVVLAKPVRLGSDPFREPVVIKQVRPQVLLDVLLDRRAVVVDRRHEAIAVFGVQMRVRGVPLALEERPVAPRAKPIAERWDRVRRQPEHVLAVGALGKPVGLRHTVQRGVMAGQKRRATRRASGRHRIVTAKRDAILPQPLHTGQMLTAVLRQLLGLVRRRKALLIGQNDQDVRALAHAPTLPSHAAARIIPIG